MCLFVGRVGSVKGRVVSVCWSGGFGKGSGCVCLLVGLVGFWFIIYLLYRLPCCKVAHSLLYFPSFLLFTISLSNGSYFIE